MSEPAFIRRLKYEKQRRDIERAKRDEIKVSRRLAKNASVKLYEIERNFQRSTVQDVKNYLQLKREEADYLIAQLITMPSTDPKIAELQGRIKAIHELVRPPVDPREINKGYPIDTDETEEDDAEA